MTATQQSLAVVSAAAALAFAAAPAAGAPAPYPTMAPLAQYLIADRNAEVAMAKSAAPPAISGEATVLVLGPHGYEAAVKGKNGFVCLVERGWMSPFDSTDFWNPKLRGPVCYNAPAARSVLPFRFKRTEWALAGWPRTKMLETLKGEAARKALPPPEPGAMSYMLSHQQYLGDTGKAWKPHLMFHVPTADAAAWGANLPGSPVIFDTAHAQGPEPETIFMVAAPAWSDGAPFAGAHDAHGH
jgi:hypothetical protein